MKYSFNYSDSNFRDAVNWNGIEYYQYPITVTINDKLFILSFGISDRKTVKIDYPFFYIVAENRGLDYISLTVIDLSDNSIQSAYLSDNDINDTDVYSYDVLNKDTDEQIKILSEYL